MTPRVVVQPDRLIDHPMDKGPHGMQMFESEGVHHHHEQVAYHRHGPISDLGCGEIQSSRQRGARPFLYVAGPLRSQSLEHELRDLRENVNEDSPNLGP